MNSEMVGAAESQPMPRIRKEERSVKVFIGGIFGLLNLAIGSEKDRLKLCEISRNFTNGTTSFQSVKARLF
jgi:hypothetical protein